MIYSRPLDTAKRSEEWAEANAELRRGRRVKQEEKPSEEAPPETDRDADTTQTTDAPRPESKASPREGDDKEFERRVQAEVDRREAVRRQRAEVQFEEKLRRENPEEYTKYKAQQALQNQSQNDLMTTIRRLSQDFDEAAVKPLMDALAEEARNGILDKAKEVHGIPQRKLLVEEGVKALKKSAYDEGYAKGKEAAQKNLRRSRSFRDELLSEIRGAEDEPEHVNGNGAVSGDRDWDMNDWMRQMTGRRSR